MGAYQVWKYWPSSPSLSPNVIHCIKSIEPDFNWARNEVSLRDFLIDPPPELNVPLPYIQPGVRIQKWIVHLTAALVWSVIGKPDSDNEWDQAWAWSPHFISIPDAIDEEKAGQLMIQRRELAQRLDSFAWFDGWSAGPTGYPEDIYRFDICLLDNTKDWKGMEVVFRHAFYNTTSIWYTFFKAGSQTKACILEAAGSRARRPTTCPAMLPVRLPSTERGTVN